MADVDPSALASRRKIVDRDYVLAVLENKVRCVGSQTAAAKACGVSVVFLHLVLHRKRPPSAKILRWIGFERVMPVEQYRRRR
jgi:hypothetical protein